MHKFIQMNYSILKVENSLWNNLCELKISSFDWVQFEPNDFFSAPASVKVIYEVQEISSETTNLKE